MITQTSEPATLLSDAQVDRFHRQKNLPVLATAMVSSIVYIGLLMSYRWWRQEQLGYEVPDSELLYLMPILIAGWIVPLCIVGVKAERMVLPCPACGTNLAKSAGTLRMTRCCRACGSRAVQGGRTHSMQVFQRYQVRQISRMWSAAMWSFPVFSAAALFISWYATDVPHRANKPAAILYALAGVVACLWCYVKYRSRRYLPPMIANIVTALIAAIVSLT